MNPLKKLFAKDEIEYLDWCLNHLNDDSEFVPLSESNYEFKSGDPKIIAYYLPQFYTSDLNDKWHGRGFTEWTNCTKTTPAFAGHYQPRLPIDVGFYSLETTAIMKRQIELAKKYGIYGFCFYYYWFHGDRLMDKPIFNFLADKSLDMPFMLFWANEHWTKNWGHHNAQDLNQKFYDAIHSADEAEKFLDDIAPFLNDHRYIKINGRPALIVYRHRRYPHVAEFIAALQAAAVKRGIPEPYIMLVHDEDPAPGNGFHPSSYNGDAMAEFAMHSPAGPAEKKFKGFKNPDARFKMWDSEKFINNRDWKYDAEYPLHRGVMTNFDSSSRRIFNNLTPANIYGITPDLYKQWLTDVLEWTRAQKDERLVFVSAWNEWAEAMYLEPCIKYGYAYLQATCDAIYNSRL